MSDTVISVENLGKKYFLSHQRHESYLALRDVLTDGVRNAARKITAPFSSRRGGDGPPTREEFWALKDVSFEIKQGDRVGIIGRNGAGKSTLLKILSRITEPTEGRVRIRGRVASLLEVGTGFHPELTGRENIFLNGAILGMKKSEIVKKYDEIVDFAEVEKFLDTPVKHYSSGMYVRLAFAVAAHLEPEILVVDEVLAVGDAQFQRKCLGRMDQIGRGGRTVLFVSHNMPSIRMLCPKALLLESGNMTCNGDTPGVLDSYITKGVSVGIESFDLCNYRRSAGRCKAILRSWLEDKNGKIVSNAIMGQPINICFEYLLETKLSNPNFGFGIETLEGQRVFSVNNNTTNPEILNVQKKGIARCKISEAILLPGTYLISFSIVDNQVEWVDYVERAMSLIVLPDDIYGTGKMYERSQGLIYTNSVVSVSEV